MICRDCNIEEATEFHGPTGIKSDAGRCLPCYERAVKKPRKVGEPVTDWNILYPTRDYNPNAHRGG